MTVSPAAALRRLRALGRGARKRAGRRVGGEQSLRAVLLLAMVVSLDGADKGTLAVNAVSLEQAFGVGHTAIGLLASIASLTSAAFTLPIGVLTDRVVRVRLLGASILLWAVVTLLSGAATSYGWLVAARALLGAVTATSGPTVASLVGDYFPMADRARLYGYVLIGEFVGTGVGIAVTSAVSAALSWRYAVAWPAVPAAVLAWFAWRAREPARGGQNLPRQDLAAPEPEQRDAAGGPEPGAPQWPGDRAGTPAGSTALRRDADPADLPWLRVVGYVLRIRTMLIMIVASTLGYFFLAGVRTFAVLFATQQYGVTRGVAGILTLLVGAGGVVGLVVGGRTADRLLAGGRTNARVIVPVVSLFSASLVLAPGLLIPTPGIAVPLLILGTGLLAATNPPLDAARLDVVPPPLWGRAESVRTAARTLGEFAAPLFFGYASSHVFTTHGLRWTFLVSLLALLAASLLGILALRTYPGDVTAAAAATAPAAR